MFLVNDRLVWRDKTVPRALELWHTCFTYGARDARAFYVFAVFKNFKSAFSEDNMPVHALDFFIENATKMVRIIPLNTKNEDQTLR